MVVNRIGMNTTTAATCFHVRGTHVVPGWGCCRCRVYNGYQRDNCRACGHPACYLKTGEMGEESKRFRTAGIDQVKIIRLCEELRR
jgi:hypothetical protein